MELSLYRLCLENVSKLLKRGHWIAINDSVNVFPYLSNVIIEELISLVLEDTASDTLFRIQLYPLLISRRIRHFTLENICLYYNDLSGIFSTLSISSENLSSLIIRNLSFKQSVRENILKRQCRKSLEYLIRKCRNLEILISCIGFNLKSIRNHKKLKVLELNFFNCHCTKCNCKLFLEYFLKNSSENLKVLKTFKSFDLNSLTSCKKLQILKFNFEIHASLSDCLMIKANEFFSNDFSSAIRIASSAEINFTEQMATVLKQCHELTEVFGDISKSLLYLNEEEGHANHHFRIQKCTLGSPLSAVSAPLLHVSTAMLPLLQELTINVDDNKVVKILSNFQQLQHLSIFSNNYIDFQGGLQPLLEKIGTKLKCFSFYYFANVDMAAVGRACPNIESISTYECKFLLNHKYSYFHNLLHLNYASPHGDVTHSLNALKLLLANCKNLTRLELSHISYLNDEFLGEILNRNALVEVTYARVLNCHKLTSNGLHQLLSNLKKLRHFLFHNFLVDERTAAEIVHSINRRIKFMWGLPNNILDTY